MTDRLRLNGITKRFGALVASDNVSLDLRAGEIHALIGPNGAGKSTLIAQIAGSLAPDAGQVWLDGQDVTSLGVADRARAGLGRSFQVSQLAMGHSALENVLLAALGTAGQALRPWRRALAHRDARDRSMAALDRVGLGARAAVATGALSHGERRQLEIACALVAAPRAFLMDEPMAGLGTSGTHDLTALLDGLRADAPILLVEHDMDAVFALADRISVLVYGQIIASGPPEIRRDPDVRRAYLGDEVA